VPKAVYRSSCHDKHNRLQWSSYTAVGRANHSATETCAYRRLSLHCCSVVLSVCLSVCLLVTTANCAKTAEPIDMLFAVWIRVGPKNHVFRIHPRVGAHLWILGIKLGMSELARSQYSQPYSYNNTFICMRMLHWSIFFWAYYVCRKYY